MKQYQYVPYEPVVGTVREVGQTVFLAEITIDPKQLSGYVPQGFTITSQVAYVLLAEAALLDEKSKDYTFVNPIFSQYYEAGILVKVNAGGHEGYTYLTRYFDKDWAVMESRMMGFDAYYAFVRTTRFPTEMMDFYYIKEGARLKAVAVDEGTTPISLGFDAFRPLGEQNFDFLFSNLIGLREVMGVEEGRKDRVICRDITHKKLCDLRYRDVWSGQNIDLQIHVPEVGKFSYSVRQAFWFLMGFHEDGIEVLQ